VQGHSYGAEFDLDDLLRMDTATLVEAEAKAVAGGFKKPNEARKRLNLTPVAGGDTPYLQQQNYSLAALAKRDSQADPFASKAPAPAAAPEKTANDNATPEQIAAAKVVAAWKLKALFADAAA
jgi:phage portal protein BeeE